MKRILPRLVLLFCVSVKVLPASLVFQMDGKFIALSERDSARVSEEIEDVVISANYNSRHHMRLLSGSSYADWTRIEDLKKHSFLRLAYPLPKVFKTVGGDIPASEVWVEIKESNPHGGLLPGPITLIAEGQPIYLVKESGVLEIRLGLDPAVYEFLPSQMKSELARAKDYYAQFLAPKSKVLFPSSFQSREAAEHFVKTCFAGGKVEALTIRSTDILVVYIHGSGVPNVGIAVYLLKTGKWEFAVEAPLLSPEVHKAMVSGNEIIVVGEKSHETRQLLKIE